VGLNWRSPPGLTAIGVVATVLISVTVITALLLTGGPTTVSENAALIGALVALGGVFTTQLVNTGLENQRAQEAALQKYLEEMRKVLADLDRPVQDSGEGDSLSTITRARTLSTLEDLTDPTRKRILLLFLYEAGLIYKNRLVIKPDLVLKDRLVVDLYGANLKGVYLDGTNLMGASLSGANLRGGRLRKAQLLGVDLSGADLSWVDLSEARLDDANLLGANLSGANLRGAFLFNANLRGASLVSQDLNRMYIESGVSDSREDFWYAIFDAIFNAADLIRDILSGAAMSGANLRGASLNGADLREADLSWANLRGADLSEAKLAGAALRETEDRRASLYKANLRGALLDGASLGDTKGLTQKQIGKAWGDKTTRLPENHSFPADRISPSFSPDEQPNGE
jgi:uncharacterized protein YjbI with pentapeptide repeats